jgi:hypothetical protein
VTTPEEMPVTETIELIDRLDVEAHVDLAAVVVNQLLPSCSPAERSPVRSVCAVRR